MSRMKLTVDTLDNEAKSAVINVGANSGYVEAYLTNVSLALVVYDKEGNVVSEQWIPIKKLKGQA
jgi:protein-L-isoaspartate O-methyltransferase